MRIRLKLHKLNFTLRPARGADKDGDTLFVLEADVDPEDFVKSPIGGIKEALEPLDIDDIIEAVGEDNILEAFSPSTLRQAASDNEDE